MAAQLMPCPAGKRVGQPWLDRAKSNLIDLFEGRRRFAFKFDVASPQSFLGVEAVADKSKGKGLLVADHQKDFDSQMQGLARRFEIGYEDDWVYSLQPYTGVGLFASILGCKSEIPDDSDPVTHQAIASAEQVDRLVVDWAKADLFNLAMEKIRYFKGQLQGVVPIASPDLQSPINTASIVCNYGELVCGMYTCPDKVHRLLGVITEVMIEATEKLVEAGVWPAPSRGSWLPRGIWLSDDLMAVLGPQAYRAFALPYAERIGRHFGGVVLHSCGNALACAPLLKEIDALIAHDFWEVSIRDFRRAGGDCLCFCPVAADAWHNLDRRAQYRTSEQVARIGLEDLKRLPEVLTAPTFLRCTCPDPHFADAYYEELVRISEKTNG